MDLRGEHRRPRVAEEPRRMPWPWIIGVVLAGIAVGSVLTQLGMSFRLRDVLPAWREAGTPPPPIAVTPGLRPAPSRHRPRR